jgi:hypothetical protein
VVSWFKHLLSNGSTGNRYGAEERDPKVLLTPLAQVLAEQDAPLNHPAMFAPSESSSKGLVPFAGPMENTAWQAGLARTWVGGRNSGGSWIWILDLDLGVTLFRLGGVVLGP